MSANAGDALSRRSATLPMALPVLLGGFLIRQVGALLTHAMKPPSSGLISAPCPKSSYSPCIPTRGTKVPSRDDWFHEVKHDGYRLMIQRDGKRVRRWTRNCYNWTDERRG